jgi:hypothetical protein
MLKALGIVPFFSILVGCATPSTVRVEIDRESLNAEEAIQKQLAFDKQYDYINRLYNISSVILRASAPMCPGDIGKTMSFTFDDKQSFGGSWETEAYKRFGVKEYPVITWLSPSGGAAAAGLQVGDEIIAVDTTKYGNGKKARKKFLKSFDAVKEADLNTANLVIERSGEQKAVTIPLQQQCNFNVKLDSSDVVNAYADGQNIIITRGMMRFANDDKFLALVVAHELGHNVMDHMDKKKTNYALGSIFDIAAAAYGVDTRGLFGNSAANAYSQDFEAEADYVSLYYLKAADLPVDGVANFWREMAAEHPGSIKTNHAATHPATSERFLAIEKTIDEIEFKESIGQSLLPDIIDK